MDRKIERSFGRQDVGAGQEKGHSPLVATEVARLSRQPSDGVDGLAGSLHVQR
jgi:hypothetical protein